MQRTNLEVQIRETWNFLFVSDTDEMVLQVYFKLEGSFLLFLSRSLTLCPPPSIFCPMPPALCFFNSIVVVVLYIHIIYCSVTGCLYVPCMYIMDSFIITCISDLLISVGLQLSSAKVQGHPWYEKSSRPYDYFLVWL